MKLGNKSLGLTLPVEMIKQLGWREKQKVSVCKHRRQLIISDWKRKR
jgi:antitoxin component of MazEF toxin-antitoxin module